MTIIFDMDGVIVDSNPFHKQAWKQFCQKYSYNLSDQEMQTKVFGRTNKEVLEYLLKEKATEDAVETYTDEKEALYRELFAATIQPVKGLMDFLKLLKQNRVPVAIATSAPPVNVEFTLKATGTAEFFDTILDCTYVTKGKPDPEIYLKTAAKMGKDPAKCIVFEDSLSGVEAALRAGMKVVGITTTHTAEELANTHLVIDSFENLTLDNLHKVLRG